MATEFILASDCFSGSFPDYTVSLITKAPKQMFIKALKKQFTHTIIYYCPIILILSLMMSSSDLEGTEREQCIGLSPCAGLFLLCAFGLF